MFDQARHNWLRDTLAPDTLPHVADVGANPIEPVPYHDMLQHRGCRVTGFEPQTHAYKALQDSKSDLESYVHCAVGDGGIHTLHYTNFASMAGLFKADAASVEYFPQLKHGMAVQGTDKVRTIALDHWDFPDFQLLKIDIQGGEVGAFQGASDKLSRAVAVISEVRFFRLYENEPMFADVDADLSARGFALHSFMHQVSMELPNSQSATIDTSSTTRQLVDGDAIYIKNLAYPENYSVEDLKQLALLADGIFNAPDLTLRCIDHLVDRAALPDTIPAAYVDRLSDHLKIAKQGQPDA